MQHLCKLCNTWYQDNPFNYALQYEKFHSGISLKDISAGDYIENCGRDSFDFVVRGIENCKLYGFKHSLSYVLTTDNIDNITSFADVFMAFSFDKNITFVLCNYLRCYQVKGNTCMHCSKRPSCFDKAEVRRRVLASNCYPAFFRGHRRIGTSEYLSPVQDTESFDAYDIVVRFAQDWTQQK